MEFKKWGIYNFDLHQFTVKLTLHKAQRKLYCLSLDMCSSTVMMWSAGQALNYLSTSVLAFKLKFLSLDG
jgi:hypothetical protein